MEEQEDEFTDLLNGMFQFIIGLAEIGLIPVEWLKEMIKNE